MAELFNNEEINSGATFNDLRTRRLSLWRIWDVTKPLVMFIGLNPSTANENTPDPTIESVIRISKHNGYGGFYMMNLFTIISSKPSILDDHNNWGDFLFDKECLIEVSKKCKDIVFAWGRFKQAEGRSAEIMRHFKSMQPLCIKKNKNGSPVHPLFQKGTSELAPFNQSTQ